MSDKTTKVKCPNCGQQSIYDPSNPYRPFCSKRCKMVDLGQWFDGSHHIPGPEMDDEAIGAINDADDPANDV